MAETDDMAELAEVKEEIEEEKEEEQEEEKPRTTAARRRLGDVLVESGLLSREQVKRALEVARGGNGRLGEALVREGLISSKDMGTILALYLNIPIVELRSQKIAPEALRRIPEEIARKYVALPLAIEEDGLVVAMADPEDLVALQDLAARARIPVKPVIATGDEIMEAIGLYYKATEQLERDFDVPEGREESRLTAETLAEAPVVRALDLLIGQAVRDRASDIHIEPQETRLRVRFRIDGILHDVMSLPVDVHPALVSRVKILAGMNIAERRRPQDGQFSLAVAGRTVDVRVATSGTVHGEMIVLRILDKAFAVMDLSQLGFLPETFDLYQNMLKLPHGMILVSGPTGSGKTTTLYASVNRMDRLERNIITIEDPVEYRFSDINQIQINTQAGMTFANQLRAILRLDPDVILVGEIRDKETATIAVQAALTGHLVLSSVHANDSVSALFRLLDLGVESYLITSALVGVVAQRMMRRICPTCRILAKRPTAECEAYKEELGEERREFFQGSGCNSCAQTGYRGRLGVFEVLNVTEELRRTFLSRGSVDDVRAQATRDGLVPMRREGMLKVKQGVTTPYEVMRAVYSLG